MINNRDDDRGTPTAGDVTGKHACHSPGQRVRLQYWRAFLGNYRSFRSPAGGGEDQLYAPTMAGDSGTADDNGIEGLPRLPVPQARVLFSFVAVRHLGPSIGRCDLTSFRGRSSHHLTLGIQRW